MQDVQMSDESDGQYKKVVLKQIITFLQHIFFNKFAAHFFSKMQCVFHHHIRNFFSLNESRNAGAVSAGADCGSKALQQVGLPHIHCASPSTNTPTHTNS
jgi:hypothetical protein